MPKVVIIKCSDYSHKSIKSSIEQVFAALALGDIIKPGQKVLLKPNLLLNFSPDKGTTTHPAIVLAVAEEVKKLGADPYVGDSHGGVGSMYEKVLSDTGIKALGLPIADLEEKGTRKIANPGGKVDPIYISNVVLGFDHVINLPKMKTHELTQITCGIKNLLGCVPGLQKIRHHLDAPTPDDFSSALVDLLAIIKPAATIVDAVVSMEGQGPSNGRLRNSRQIIASRDTVAADAVCSAIMGFEPMDIPTTRIADKRNLGEGHMEHIQITGDGIEVIRDFAHPGKVSSILNKMPHAIILVLRPILEQIKRRPSINRKKCTKCMICVKSCPTHAIDKNSFKINKNQCIMCLCCRELCRYGAVDLKDSTLWKILNKLGKLMT